MRNQGKFAADQSHNYVVVDFDNVTEKGLSKLISALKASGSPVESVEAPNKQQKKDGETVKRAKLFFENGQTMTLFIGDHGDVYQMTLNATKQPIPSVKNERELAREMTRLLERNQQKFDKQQARKAAKPVRDPSSTRPASRSLAKRLDEANQAEAIARSNFNGVQSAHAQMSDLLSKTQSNVLDLEKELALELEETRELEAQLEAI